MWLIQGSRGQKKGKRTSSSLGVQAGSARLQDHRALGPPTRRPLPRSWGCGLRPPSPEDVTAGTASVGGSASGCPLLHAVPDPAGPQPACFCSLSDGAPWSRACPASGTPSPPPPGTSTSLALGPAPCRLEAPRWFLSTVPALSLPCPQALDAAMWGCRDQVPQRTETCPFTLGSGSPKSRWRRRVACLQRPLPAPSCPFQLLSGADLVSCVCRHIGPSEPLLGCPCPHVESASSR